MKKEWKYEGKKYVITGNKDKKMYLNKYICDCTEILDGLESGDTAKIFYAKIKAKHVLVELSKRHDHEPHKERLIEELGLDYEQKQKDSYMKWLKEERRKAKEMATREINNEFWLKLLVSAFFFAIVAFFLFILNGI